MCLTSIDAAGNRSLKTKIQADRTRPLVFWKFVKGAAGSKAKRSHVFGRFWRKNSDVIPERDIDLFICVHLCRYLFVYCIFILG